MKIVEIELTDELVLLKFNKNGINQSGVSAPPLAILEALENQMRDSYNLTVSDK